MGRDRSGVRTTNSMQETSWPWGQHHLETPHCSDSRPLPRPSLPFRVCFSGGLAPVLAHAEEHLEICMLPFPVLGTWAAWRPQSTSLAISGACLSSRVEGWERAPVLFPVLPEGVERKAVTAPGRDCQGPDVWARGRKGTGKGGFVSVWEGRDWKRSP